MTRLTPVERLLLLLPLLGGAVFGLVPLLIPQTFAQVTGYAGDDPLVARLAGAATLGYAVALVVGLRDGLWRPIRLVVLAVLVFNLASLYACVADIFAGGARPVVFLILATSVALVAISAWLLLRHRDPPLPADAAPWVIGFVAALALVAAVFGLLPLFVPGAAPSVGAHGTDAFLFRQAGAATLGYAVMGVFETRSRVWLEMRLPLVMALAFNLASFLASAAARAGGDASLLSAIVVPASLVATVGLAAAIRREAR